MNITVLIGRLTKDVEVRYTSGSQTAVASFNVAVDRYGDGTDFPRCKAFGKTAENLGRYCHKGSKIAIRGRIETGSYEKDGKTIYTQEVVADSIEFLDSKKSEEFVPDAPDQGTFEELKEDVPF